jgi:hypothetical protein
MTPEHALDRRLEQAVIRIYERYAREVVERFDLCPWAERARHAGRVKLSVSFESDPANLGPSLADIVRLGEDPEVEVGLLVYPRFRLNRRDFEHHLRLLRMADSERHEPGRAPFAMAAFHPEAEADLGHADRLVPFVRRSPDPTVQLVRKSVLDEVNRGGPTGTSFLDVHQLGPLRSPRAAEKREPTSVRQWVAERNLATVERVRPEALEAIFSDIERDRATTYAALGLLA